MSGDDLKKKRQQAELLLAEGLRHHQSGDFRGAEVIYLRVLDEFPDHPEALNLTGILATQIGRPDLAVGILRRAIDLRPNFPVAYVGLGNALVARGLSKEAIGAFYLATQFNPEFAEAFYNLANAQRDVGQCDDAIASYQRAITIKPEFAAAHHNLGNVLRSQGRVVEAIASLRRAIECAPKLAEGHSNLGNALKDHGDLDQAIAAYRRAIELKPDYAEAHHNLGHVLGTRMQFNDAISAFERATQLKPQFAQAYNDMGIVLGSLGRMEDAQTAYLAALRIRPDYADAISNLAMVHKDQARVEEAIDLLRRAISLKPDDASIHSNLLYVLHFQSEADPQKIFAEHLAWAARHAEPMRADPAAHSNDRRANRRLRIGYVSSDFRSHSVAYFLLPLLAGRDRLQVEVFCYSDVVAPDEVTREFQKHADHWRTTFAHSDAGVATLVREDQIDILVDLAGHTGGNRLLAFARRPAPVQVTYLGYPDTTGMSAMDYRLTDALADPPGQTEQWHTEKLVRLAHGAWCFWPLMQLPAAEREARASPAQSVQITFGCFNALAKISPAALDVWAQILQRVPGSRLLLKAAGLSEPKVRQRLHDDLARRGVAADRVEMLQSVSDIRAHLDLYRRVDIALDTFPYHGTTTTCQALWMGAPLVSLAGKSHFSRVGVSLLTHVGLPELIAQSPAQYVDIAVRLANDPAELADLHRGLQSRMKASPLMDARQFAADVESAYREMWKTWCAS